MSVERVGTKIHHRDTEAQLKTKPCLCVSVVNHSSPYIQLKITPSVTSDDVGRAHSTQRRRRMRTTPHSASAMMPQCIFERPSRRSTKTIGTSAMRSLLRKAL